MQYHAVLHQTTAATVPVIPAPGAGYRLVIVGLHLSEGAAPGAVTLGFSATNQRVWNLAANQSEDIGFMRWLGDANAAFSLAAAAAGPTDVTVDYEIEVAP